MKINKIPNYIPDIDKTDLDAVTKALKNKEIAIGPDITNFEKSISGYLDSNYVVVTSSGTSALHLALLSCGVKKGDLVITQSFTFIKRKTTYYPCY